MSEQVDFRAVKEVVTMEAVLKHYGLLDTLKPKKDGFRGPCPFHDANQNSRSFHVSTSLNLWNCFGCPRGGDVLVFVQEREDFKTSREAALFLKATFSLRPASPPTESVGEENTEPDDVPVETVLL